GLTNFIAGTVTRAASNGPLGEVDTGCGPLRCSLPAGARGGDKVVGVLRPEDIELVRDGTAAENTFEGTVADTLYMGECREFRVVLKAASMRIKQHPSVVMQPGTTVRLTIAPERCRALLA